jgi:hypothetical protein
MDYSSIANKFQRATNATPAETVKFLANVQSALTAPPPLAQDSLPFSLKGKDQMPSNFLNELLGTMPPRGGGFNPLVNGKDQYPTPQPPPTTSNTAPGSFTANIDQAETPPIDCDLLMHFVEICLNKLNGEEKDKFIGSLHTLLSGGIDQMLTLPKTPKPVQPTGSNTTLDRGIRSGRRNTANDRNRSPAQDRAIRANVAAVNQRGFLARFPEAKNIKFSSNGRY